jgi:DNA topoisomerase-1
MNEVAEAIESIPKRRIKTLIKSPVKSAEAVNLVYVNDTQPGIERVRNGNSFEYFFKGEKITDEEQLLRFKRLVIPPAWEAVWICPLENGHLQVTGID